MIEETRPTPLTDAEYDSDGAEVWRATGTVPFVRKSFARSIERTNADLAEALDRIANMKDRDGNAIEMHRDELRGIALAALAR